MKSMIELNKLIFTVKFPWNLWVGILAAVNMGGGLIYIRTFEGQLTLACLMLAFMIMWGIYVKKGFVRLLGLGHLVAWPPLMVWIFKTVEQGGAEAAFQYWMLSILVVNGISLVIDVVDVVRYSLGERKPMNI